MNIVKSARIIVLSIAIIFVAGLISFIVYVNWNSWQCTFNGGLYENVGLGLSSQYECVFPYADAGKPCTSSSECLGRCYLVNPLSEDKSAMCTRTIYGPQGCIQSIEAYNEGGFVTCYD